MAKFSLIFALLAVNLVSAAVVRRAPLSPDPAGAANVGNGQGKQFITGQCTSNADCQSTCCATLGDIGICSGPAVADQQGKSGCGFNGGAGGAGGATGGTATGTNNGGTGAAAGSGKPAGTQFITGPCANDGECASGCCGFKSGKCAGAIIAQERDGGCGFGNPTPNDDAARKLRGQSPATSSAAAPPANTGTANNGSGGAAAGSGKPAGTQFITGPCANDGECASGCCGFKSGKCAGAIIAQERDGGCGFGNATPNDDAARKLRGQA